MKYKYLLFLALAWCVISCYDDKGNYDYKEINELKISGIEDKVYYEKIAFVDSLKIYPEIESPWYNDDHERYQFTWKLIPSTADVNVDGDTIDYVVSQEKNLILPITEKVGTYRGFFIVSDPGNGISWYKNFYLRVRTLTSEGWMVLCDKGGESRLDIIFNVNENEDMIAHDLWQELNFRTGKPIKLINSYRTGGGSARLFISEKGTYNMDKLDLHVGEDNNLRWEFGAQPEKVEVRASGISQFGSQTSYWIVVDKNGDAYLNDKKIWGSIFDFPINKLEGKTPFVAAPFVGVNYVSTYSGPSVMMYDETNKQFVEVIDGASYPSVMKFNGTQLFSAQTGQDMVHLESTKNGYNYAILRDPRTGKYFFYGIILNASGKNTQEYYGEVFGPNLDRVKQFACHHMYPYLFYAVDNKVYQFDMSHPDRAAKEVLSFPGETIQVIKFTAFVAWEAYKDWERARNYQLLVATNVEDKDENGCGIVRMYDVPNLMGDLVQKKEHMGLGKIVDVTYRERDK